MPRKSVEVGVPQSDWYDEDWQITTWETQAGRYIVRVDGPEGRFWETLNLKSRAQAWAEGVLIIKGFLRDAEST